MSSALSLSTDSNVIQFFMSKSSGSLALSLAGYSMMLQGLLFPFRLSVRKQMPKIVQLANDSKDLSQKLRFGTEGGKSKTDYLKDIWGLVKGTAPFAILWSIFFYRSFNVIC